MHDKNRNMKNKKKDNTHDLFSQVSVGMVVMGISSRVRGTKHWSIVHKLPRSPFKAVMFQIGGENKK